MAARELWVQSYSSYWRLYHSIPKDGNWYGAGKSFANEEQAEHEAQKNFINHLPIPFSNWWVV